MGEHFYINQFTFKSELPAKEFGQAWEKFTSKLDDGIREYTMANYGFTYRGSLDEKLHKYKLWMRIDSTNNAKNVELLATFVSSVITHNTHILIELETGGNEMWGYLVVLGKIYDLNYSFKIDVDGIPLEKFLAKIGKTPITI